MVNGSAEQKQSYIDKSNDERAFAAEMSLDQLDDHIATLQFQFEEARRALFSARAVRQDKLDKLTEDERRERRKIEIAKEVKIKVPREPKPKTAQEKLAKTLKTNLGVVNDFMTLDVDSLLAKYQKSKEQQK
jgi:hypothetical protein